VKEMKKTKMQKVIECPKGAIVFPTRLVCEVAACVGKGLYFRVLAYSRLKKYLIDQERGLKTWRI